MITRFRAAAVLAAAFSFVMAMVLPAGAVTSTDFPSCWAQTTVHPFPSGTTLTSAYRVDSPPANLTYDFTGVTSTAYPSSNSPFAFGNGTPAKDLCVSWAKVQGKVDPTKTWEYYHSNYNAACVKTIGTDWTQIVGIRCDSLEDGFRPEEPGFNTNTDRVLVSETHLTNIRDDCIENDFTLGGLLYNNLWDGCNTGVSERPDDANIAAAGGSWTSPAGETLTLDHMLIGLQKTPHASKGFGENTIFKWSASANHLIVKCSIFKVDAVSLNGKSSMNWPAGTVVDDSACPNSPTTIVWLGGGSYPGTHPSNVKVVSTLSTWTNAANAWVAAHGY